MHYKLPLGLFVLGALLVITASILGWRTIPSIFETQIKKEFQLKNGTELWDNWVETPLPIYLSFYIFNLTNWREFERGATPQFDQLGPYVYRGRRWKEQVELSSNGETVSFRQFTSYVLDESSANVNDRVTILNIPFTVSAMILSSVSVELANILLKLLQIVSLGTESVTWKNVRVRDLLFDGIPISFYAEPFNIISQLAETMNITLPQVPGGFADGRMGLYMERNHTDDGVYTMNTGLKDSSQFGRLLTWNNKTELDWWGQTANENFCNMINGTDGSMNPPLVTKDDIVRIFNPGFCRSFYLTYKEQVKFLGIPAYRFTVPPEFFEDPQINGDNKCFCTKPGKNGSNCLKAGVFKISSCQQGAPVVLSYPHFYMASEMYPNQSLGMRPNSQLHEFYIDIEPYTGSPIRARAPIQINIELKGMSQLHAFKNIPDMLFPIFWTNQVGSMDEDSADEMKRKLLTPLKIIDGVKWGVVALGILLIIVSTGLCIRQMRAHK